MSNTGDPPLSTDRPPVDFGWLAQAAAKMAGLGYWYWEAATGLFTWSDEMFAIYGLDPQMGSLSMAELDAFCHPDDRAAVAAHRVTWAGLDNRLETRIVRPDGEIRYVIAQSAVIRGPDGRMRARYGTLADVSDIKRAEAVARENEARYRFVAEHAPDMISRVTPSGEITYVSASCDRVFGYTVEEHIRLKPQDMCHPDDLPSVVAALSMMVERRIRSLDEPLCYRARHKDGRWIWIEANPTLILDPNGEPLEFVDIVRDVTQTKLFEAQLDEARRQAEAAAAAKSSFLANMSHELRTPLTSIIGFAHLLQQQDLSSEGGRYARRISHASEALLSIINDVLDFSKLEAGQVALEAMPVSVAKLTEEAIGLLQVQAQAKGIGIELDLDPDTPDLIEGDIARLRQVVLNLLSNAVKFTSEGKVTVRTRWSPGEELGRLRLSVVDTGPGITADSLSRLFERFSQADNSINRTHGGTGLGLAICKGIIELMGGHIGVDSQAGQGSSFWFEIPARPAQAALPPEPAAAPDGCSALRVLMVDDTAVNRELVGLMLRPLGIEFEEAEGGAEGVKAAMSRRFDLILMDVRMPGVDGLEATRVIRGTSALNRATPILAITADVQPENASACRSAGMNDVLAKPIVVRELLDKIVLWTQGPSDSAAGEADGAAPPDRSRALARRS